MTHLGVCQTWDFEPTCCDLPDETDAALVEYWQTISSEILWTASGRRQGLCEVTVRPCLRRCGGGFGWTPYKGSDGQWRNFVTCGCVDDCSCVELCEVVLDGPVAEVTQVLIGTDELPPDSYRLDLVGGQYRLLRTDGGCWPDCSDFTKECGEEGAFCVTYLKGVPLDALAIAANSELTCELVKACIPGCQTCRLPSNVTSVVRRGVVITFDNSKAWLRSLPIVAQFLNAVNPQGLTSASTVWSPDVPAVRLTPEPTGS